MEPAHLGTKVKVAIPGLSDNHLHQPLGFYTPSLLLSHSISSAQLADLRLRQSVPGAFAIPPAYRCQRTSNTCLFTLSLLNPVVQQGPLSLTGTLSDSLIHPSIPTYWSHLYTSLYAPSFSASRSWFLFFLRAISSHFYTSKFCLSWSNSSVTSFTKVSFISPACGNPTCKSHWCGHIRSPWCAFHPASPFLRLSLMVTRVWRFCAWPYPPGHNWQILERASDPNQITVSLSRDGRPCPSPMAEAVITTSVLGHIHSHVSLQMAWRTAGS